MFEKASRMKLRFDTDRGMVSVEDLWGFPLTHPSKTSLDGIARSLYAKLKSADGISFVRKGTNTELSTQLKFDIVRHIIDVRLSENDENERKQAASEQAKKIRMILAEREESDLRDKSPEELQAMLVKLA